MGGGGMGGMGGGGMGGMSGGGMGGTAEIIIILSNLIPEVIDPVTGELLSYMVYNPATNQLIAHNVPANLTKLEAQLNELDVTPKQVSIESKFLTISVNDLDKLGFNWNLSQTDLNSRSRRIGDGSFVQDTLNDPSGVFGLQVPNATDLPNYSYDINGDGVSESIPFYTRPDGTSVINNTVTRGVMQALTNPGGLADNTMTLAGVIMDNGDGDMLRVTMNYLNRLSETELLSAPRVTTLNRKPAMIADYSTRVFQTGASTQLQTATSDNNATAGSVTNFEYSSFIDGIGFSVTPAITGGDQVRLWLNPQVNTIDGTDTFTSEVANINGQRSEVSITYPRTRTQSVWTNVIVKDGDTLVLGGMIQDSTTRDQERTPYLADIPVLGFFFRGKNNAVRQSSLLIFVTVDIIDPTGARFFESQAG
jgi:type II secretory pathway component GspD/PulD (secretin)